MDDASRRDPSGTQPVVARAADTKRRRFLTFGVGAAAGAAAASPLFAAPAAVVAAPAEPTAESQGYRETQHVLDYYASTRL